eukprot:TRINITY_DN29728_c0_g1_i1.p1 TRINITY_DN29728_c0_g1~~TRINITY_DN29728_c0_g1_i1.p1  ORF type:complete len:143 (+),score=35.12 TRINITY_DN29728_c0_g1_i1:93-521(+)
MCIRDSVNIRVNHRLLTKLRIVSFAPGTVEEVQNVFHVHEQLNLTEANAHFLCNAQVKVVDPRATLALKADRLTTLQIVGIYKLVKCCACICIFKEHLGTSCICAANQSCFASSRYAVSYTHLRAHETPEHLVCRLLLEKKK